jgi:rod shape-determining protein MreC
MPVLDDRAVIGQVDGVFQAMSQVVLISDPDHALPVQVLPGGERTIAYGSGSLDLLRLTDLPMNAAVRPGDLVVTSGIGGRFPAGLPVARIDRIERPAGRAFATAEATPLARMDRNRLVLVLEIVGTGARASAPTSEDRTEPRSDASSGDGQR